MSDIMQIIREIIAEAVSCPLCNPDDFYTRTVSIDRIGVLAAATYRFNLTEKQIIEAAQGLEGYAVDGDMIRRGE